MSPFSLRVSPSDKVQLVISVSKKVSKSAVVRNTIKRRIRPIVRGFDLKPAKYLLIAQSGSASVKGKTLEAELFRMFKQ